MSKPVAIHQFVRGLGYGDAISNYAIDFRQLLHTWGYDSEIYVDHFDPRVARFCRPYTTYQHHNHNVLIYHYGIASNLTRFLLNWPDRLVLIYHNITPSHFFEFEDSQLYKILKQGREELRILNVIPCAVGDSEYNCCELRSFGFKNIQVLPYLLNLGKLDQYTDTPAERQILTWLDDGYVNILFVGRIVPNKRQDELIRFLAYYQKLINPRTRLLLVGWISSKYKKVLEMLAETLKIGQDVHIVGQLELEAGFTAYYKKASVFVSFSEHEGFGVPLLESMHFGVPIIAYAATAVPETMGDAGILVSEKRFDVVGELVNLLVTEQQFREKIIRKQKERLQDFNRSRLEMLFKNWVLELEERFS